MEVEKASETEQWLIAIGLARGIVSKADEMRKKFPGKAMSACERIARAILVKNQT